MKASYKWLAELSGVDADPEEVAERLTRAGLEVEGITPCGQGLERVVVGEVRASRAHPKRDKLSLVTVFDGEQEQEVVCGAPNVPEPGGRILFARLGAELPNGMTIEERKIGGEVSRGMICSEVELDIGPAAEGIFVLGDDAPAPGTPIVEALDLQDWIYEIGLTPNRPDGLGHIGLAREVALMFGAPFSPPSIEPPAALAQTDEALVPEDPKRISLAEQWQGGAPERREPPATEAGPIAVDITHPDRCPRYGAALVLGVRIGPSPWWLRYRLHCLGVRPISNVVDVTNLVMLERCHPIHAFDLERIRGSRIEVRRAREGEKMTTLDDVERTMTDDDLLICDGEGPVAIAGVMGGADSEIGEGSQHVLIECAYFAPRSVRRTSRRVGLHTEASHRFERGVDPDAVPAVLARTVSLMQRLSGGVAVEHALDAHPQQVPHATICLEAGQVGALMGYEVQAEEVRRVLEGIGCVVREAQGRFEVTAPGWRPDLGRPVDLVEEVARVRGYDAIPTEVPRVRPSEQGSPREVGFDRRARRLAAAAGLQEVVNYAFLARHELEAVRAPGTPVPLANPLSEERSVMRTSLLPGLVANARHAMRRQVERVALFELGRTYHPSDDRLPVETPRLAVLLSGPRPRWIGDEEPYDFYDGKGAVERVLEPLVGAMPQTVLDETLGEGAPFLHPRKRARVVVAGRPVGVLGELHPDVADAVELPERAVYAELGLEALLAAADAVGVPQATPLPRYPAVTRDIAMVVSEAHSAEAIAEALRGATDGLAERVRLFDLYRGEPVPEGHRSLAFRVTYRDPEATLTDKRVDKVHAKAAKAAEERFGAQLR